MRPFPLPTLFVPLLLLAAAHSVSLIYSHRAGELLTVSDRLYLFVPALAALASWQAVRGARDRRLAVWAAACLAFLAGAEVILVAAYDLRDLRAPITASGTRCTTRTTWGWWRSCWAPPAPDRARHPVSGA